MKKKYVKPQIIIENFSLCTHIAGDCNVIIGNQAEYTCPYVDRTGNNVFTEELSAICTDIKQADGVNNSVCYHVPIETNDLFNS